MHPEVRAYIQVEQLVRRRRVAHQVMAVLPALVAGVALRAMTHLALGPAFEGHLGAAFELVALAAPVIAALAVTRARLARWADGKGVQVAAQIAALHGVAPLAVREALHAR